jgi:hypothetical protein
MNPRYRFPLRLYGGLNLLMEPNLNLDLTTSLVPPKDLTKPLLSDLGW